MRYVIAFIALVVLIFGAATYRPARATQDASSAWASVASSYSFAASSSFNGQTFEQAYQGNKFEVDFPGILSAVASLMSTTVPPFDGDEVMSASLQSWPDS